MVCARTVALIRGGAFQEAPRRDPDLELLRPCRVGWRDVLLLVSRYSGAAGHGCGEGDPRRPRRGLREINRAHVVVEVRARPRRVAVVVLAEIEARARTPERHGAQAVDAHRSRRVADDGGRVLRSRWGRQQSGDHDRNETFLDHGLCHGVFWVMVFAASNVAQFQLRCHFSHRNEDERPGEVVRTSR